MRILRHCLPTLIHLAMAVGLIMAASLAQGMEITDCGACHTAGELTDIPTLPVPENVRLPIHRNCPGLTAWRDSVNRLERRLREYGAAASHPLPLWGTVTPAMEALARLTVEYHDARRMTAPADWPSRAAGLGEQLDRQVFQALADARRRRDIRVMWGVILAAGGLVVILGMFGRRRCRRIRRAAPLANRAIVKSYVIGARSQNQGSSS